MASLDLISLAILLGALLVLAGILSSLIAMRFGAPLLLIFLLVGVLAGESGPGGIEFNDVRLVYLVGSVALALILFDGGLRTRLVTFRSVLAPSAALATLGVFITAAVIAPAGMALLGLNWTEGLLLGAVLASTDAAAVFFLIHARGLRLRPRVGATLEVESGINDPFAIFLTLILVEVLMIGDRTWLQIIVALAQETVLGTVFGLAGGWAIVLVLNRLNLAQGLHAPFVTTGAVLIFAVAEMLHGSGFLAVYLAGLLVGNRPTRAHNLVEVFLDAVTWLAQIVMFVLLGLLAWPERLVGILWPALVVAAVLILIARPVAVVVCLAPFRFPWKEKAFISWVGLRGAVSIFLASIPLLVGLPNGNIYFDVAFVVVFASLLVQGWTIALAAYELQIALPYAEAPRRVELDLPGQLAQELVGYEVGEQSLYLRRRLIPGWARPTLVVRDEKILMPAEAEPVREGDYVYLLAPPEKARALDRFFVEMPPPSAPDPRLLEDFVVSGDATLGALREIYGLEIADSDTGMPLSDYFATHIDHTPKPGDIVALGAISLVAHSVVENRVTQVGLQLAEPDPVQKVPPIRRTYRQVRRGLRKLGVHHVFRRTRSK